MMIVADVVVDAVADVRIDDVRIDDIVAGGAVCDTAAERLQRRRQRWRAGGGCCRAPEAPARRTGGGYAAGCYRHAGVEWDSTWRALCHAHGRHHSPLHDAFHPLLELSPRFGLESTRRVPFLRLCLFLGLSLCRPSLPLTLSLSLYLLLPFFQRSCCLPFFSVSFSHARSLILSPRS